MENHTKLRGSVEATQEEQEHENEYPLIGLFIKEFRENLEMSQTEFCQLTGFKQSQLSLIETGNYNLKFNQVLQICSALKVEPLAFISNYFDKHRMCPDIPTLQLEDYEEAAKRTMEILKEKRKSKNDNQRKRLIEIYA